MNKRRLREVSDVELVYRLQALTRRNKARHMVMSELLRRFPEAVDVGHAVRLALRGPGGSVCGSIDMEFLRAQGWL